MRTVVMGPVPDELAALLEKRRATGADLYDEVWEGDDYRVPDRGLHRAVPSGTWVDTAALVVEIVSPDDETWAKLAFYAAREVDELVVADPHSRTLHWLARSAGGAYEPIEASVLLGVDAAAFAEQIDWPPRS